MIGSKIAKNILSIGGNVLILDIKKNKDLKNIKYIKFNCEKLNSSEKIIKKIIKEYGCPDVFINCSYPRTKDWNQCSFKKINLKRMSKNIEIHMNSFAWISKIMADEMVKRKVKGSIVNLNSIYGLLGQDLNIYEKTSMTENMPYSIIKGGINNLTRQMASFYGQYTTVTTFLCPLSVQPPEP